MPSNPARNIGAYEQAYLSSDFEATQAAMRKRMLTQLLQAWQPRRVLEVGCGAEPLFSHWSTFEQWTVVEPGPRFAAMAREHAGTDTRIEVIEATLEAAAEQIVYHQARNAAARRSHTKTTRRKLRESGIDCDTLPRCRWSTS